MSDLQYYKAGETVEVTIQRASGGVYEEKVLQVTLAKQVMSSADQGNAQSGQNPYQNPNRNPNQNPGGEEYGNGLFDDWLN